MGLARSYGTLESISSRLGIKGSLIILFTVAFLMGETQRQAGYGVLSQPRSKNKREGRIWAVFNASRSSVISNSKGLGRAEVTIEQQLSGRR